MVRTLLLLCTLGMLTGCRDAGPPPSRTPAAQRAHDSTLGASRLPGAGGVRGALRATDSAEARRAREAATTAPETIP